MKKFASVRSTTVMAIITLICIMIVPVGAAFQDVPQDNWAVNYIDYAEAYGLINGIGDGKFAPNATLTEAQCCQIVYNTLVAPTTKSSGVRWYTDAVNWVQQRWPGRTIAPERTATRLFVCELVERFAALPAPATTADGNYTPKEYNIPFSDCKEFTGSEKVAVGWCWQEGIVDGFPDRTFHPYDNLTRAQGAKIFALWHHRNSWNSTPNPAKPMSLQQRAQAEAETMARYAKSLGWKVDTAPWPYNHDDGTFWYELEASNGNGTFNFLVGGSVNSADTWWHIVTQDGFKNISKESVKASLVKWAT